MTRHHRAPLRTTLALAGGLLLALSLAWPGAPARAAKTPAATPERSRAIERIEAYFQKIKTLRAEFVQIGPDGEIATGKLYLSRPGRVRFEYAPPSPLLIVSNGELLYFYDSELGQVNSWPIDDTPIAPILRSHVRLEGKAEVRKVKREKGRMEITLAHPHDPEAGSLTLVFTEPPLALREWRVRDAQGLVTTVALTHVEINPPLHGGLFVFDDPRLRRPFGAAP